MDEGEMERGFKEEMELGPNNLGNLGNQNLKLESLGIGKEMNWEKGKMISKKNIGVKELPDVTVGEGIMDQPKGEFYFSYSNCCCENLLDTEILESDWTSFKYVLLEIIGDQPETPDPSVTRSNWNLGGTEISTVPSIKEEEADNYLEKTHDNLLVIPMDGSYETNSNNIPIKKRSGTKLQFLQEDSSETFRGDPFRPTYKKEERKANVIELGIQSNEEGDLLKELNKIAGKAMSSFQSMALAFDSSTAWKDPKDEPMDDIIAAIADLS
ncbi:hypothetical protein F3Y22_tig00110348pilonHSYRG00217 [Hibiscus syriacus]|uniref:Uncharacterized protein n=1 Tax=Hibiscus syriacus TaxID=106335 RepID=A0A6A3AV97_HIBSY|nr:hypothetical protein F3Y22_tig00110348pilonHSYRG00217 [Hibiscus syriacus]